MMCSKLTIYDILEIVRPSNVNALAYITIR